MTYAITSYTQCETLEAKAFIANGGSAILSFANDIGKEISAHVPPHVAEHTAAAFNRAMQAEKQADGSFIYQTDQGAWSISLDTAMRKVWHFQNEEVTGDGDPHWLTGTAPSIMEALDAIDDLIEENACTDCGALVGGENCIEAGDDEFICQDCAEKRHKHEVSMQEMADDDRYHAWADDQREAAQ